MATEFLPPQDRIVGQQHVGGLAITAGLAGAAVAATGAFVGDDSDCEHNKNVVGDGKRGQPLLPVLQSLAPPQTL